MFQKFVEIELNDLQVTFALSQSWFLECATPLRQSAFTLLLYQVNTFVHQAITSPNLLSLRQAWEMFKRRMFRSCLASFELQFSINSIPSLQSLTAPFKSFAFNFSLPLCLSLEAYDNFYSSLNSHFSFFLSLKSTSSTSKFRVELGGMLGGEPLAPQAYQGEQIRVAFSPLFIVAKPQSQPLMTLPCPSTKLKGFYLSRFESKTVPFCRVPLQVANISCPFLGVSPSPSLCTNFLSLPSTITTSLPYMLDMQQQQVNQIQKQLVITPYSEDCFSIDF